MDKSIRRGEIDIFRGIGIILMVLGHVGFEGGYNTFVHAFHMPMFFIVSGLMYKPEENFIVFFKKRIRTLVIPYLIFGAFHVAAASVIRGFSPDYLKSFFWFSTDIIPIGGAIWFFISMFSAQIITRAGLSIKNRFLRTGAFAVIGISGQLLKQVFGIVLPYGIGPGMVGAALIYIGYTQRDNYIKIQKIKFPLWAVISIAAVFLGKTEGYTDMRQEIYPNILLFWAASVLFSISLLRLSSFIENKMPNIFTTGWLRSIGRNSAIYLAFNEIVLSALKRFSPVLGLPQWAEYTTVIVLTFVILFAAAEIFNRTPLKKLLGR